MAAAAANDDDAAAAADEEGVPAASWPTLPPDLVTQILSRFTNNVHYLRARLACRRWAKERCPRPVHLPLQPPFIHFSDFSTRGPYFSLTSGNTHHLPLPSAIANADVRCFGSSHGRLLLLGSDSSIFAFNPANHNHARFPPLSAAPADMVQFPKEFFPYYLVFQDPTGNPLLDIQPTTVQRRDLIRLSVLSSDPADDPNFAMLIILKRFARKYLYCRCGEAAWAVVSLPLGNFHCDDIAPTRSRKIYAVDCKTMALVAFDFSRPTGNVAVSSYSIFGVPRSPPPDAAFLVESTDGSLLLVNKILEVRAKPYDATLVLFKLDVSEPPQARAVQMTDIGPADGMFVCEGGSGCVDLRSFPRALWPNHIYFFRPYHGYAQGEAFEAETLRVFSLESGKLAIDPCRLPSGWPKFFRGKCRWVFFNIKD